MWLLLVPEREFIRLTFWFISEGYFRHSHVLWSLLLVVVIEDSNQPYKERGEGGREILIGSDKKFPRVWNVNRKWKWNRSNSKFNFTAINPESSLWSSVALTKVLSLVLLRLTNKMPNHPAFLRSCDKGEREIMEFKYKRNNFLEVRKIVDSRMKVNIYVTVTQRTNPISNKNQPDS